MDLIDDRQAIDILLASKLEIFHHYAEPEPLAANALLSKITDEDVFTVDIKLADLGMASTQHNRLAIASHLYPSMHFKLGTSIINPPAEVHRMQKGDRYYIGDLYSADMLISCLEKNKINMLPDHYYLDFGCSSGSLLRILKAYEPAANLFGVDPIRSSVEWAQRNVRGVDFSTSNVKPPLPYGMGTFHGVSAVSIWSHLGEVEAISWFDEMHRIIKPNGWLFFTTHGDSSLHFYNREGLYLPRRILALLEGLVNSNFVFEEVYLGESPEGLSADGYGNAYMRPSWVKKNLSEKWKILYFGPAENQGNQDTYVLARI
ncbi:UNVERIFIED_ORG: SAM-dependent methyltransferase [Ensifer adhaerens]|nr:SAM-dependent methyltransferase [Ensifer adhaerens]